MYYNMAKASSACSHSFGGSVCFHSFGGSAGGTESGLSPSSHPASSASAENLSAAAEYRPGLIRLLITRPSIRLLITRPSIRLLITRPSIRLLITRPSIRLLITRLTHPSVFTRPPIYQLSPACTHPPAPLRLLSRPLHVLSVCVFHTRPKMGGT